MAGSPPPRAVRVWACAASLNNNALRSVDARLVSNAFAGCPLLDALECVGVTTRTVDWSRAQMRKLIQRSACACGGAKGDVGGAPGACGWQAEPEPHR